MTRRSVLFRCDASPAIGAGHVSRCLALAEAFDQSGFGVNFLVGPETLGTCPELADRGDCVHVLARNEDEVAAVRAFAGGGMLVVDHYGRDAQFEHACRPSVGQILVFDDATGRGHDCDVLLDAAAQSQETYRDRAPASARFLCGLSFATLRGAFRAARPAALSRRDGRPVRRVLVSCGATDPGNVTRGVLTALSEFSDALTVDVALSGKAPHLEDVRRALPTWATLHVDARNMANLMTEADISVGTPGATSYERAALGLPSILVIVAENQRGIYDTFIAAGGALGAGGVDDALSGRVSTCLRSLFDDAGQRVRLSKISSRLVDGRGSFRVALALIDAGRAADGRSVRLRLAETQDEGSLLDLQRQPSIRRFFRNPQVPSAEEHHAWLTRTLFDTRQWLYVIEVDGRFAGSLRLDEMQTKNSPRVFEVSIAVDAEFERRGVATEALRFAQRLLPGARLHAEVAAENAASQRLFLRAGFAQTSAETFAFGPH